MARRGSTRGRRLAAWLLAAGVLSWTVAAWPQNCGAPWVKVEPHATRGVLKSVAWDGTRYVAVGTAGRLLTSADGAAWLPVSDGPGGLAAIVYGGGQFVAVGSRGAIYTSPDGLAWTPRLSGVTANLRSVASDGSFYVAGGDGGALVTSPDAQTWTLADSNGSEDLIQVVHGDGLFVVTGAAGAVLLSPCAVAPVVTGLTPASGPTEGGTVVSVAGASFTGATAVSFGTLPAASFTVVSDLALFATSPAQASGAVDVTVTTPAGTSAAVGADKFTYVAAPAVTGLSPTSGPELGGTTVTIAGTGFAGATSVKFGVVPAASYTIASAAQITAVSPPQTPATVDVLVTTVGGTNAATGAGRFTYVSGPILVGLSPSSGPASGGTTVTLSGTNFRTPVSVLFGAAPALSVDLLAPGTIKCLSPPGTGAVDVTVITPDGTTATGVASKFAYLSTPALTSVSPPGGSALGSTSVTITGSGFQAGATVTFGEVPALGVVVANPATITVSTPAHPPGSVAVAVTNPDGQSAALSSAFAYVQPPLITLVKGVPNPYRLQVLGSNFHGTCTIWINGSPAPQTVYKSATQVNAKGGAALKAMLPQGVAVQITVTNNDDGITSTGYTFVR